MQCHHQREHNVSVQKTKYCKPNRRQKLIKLQREKVRTTRIVMKVGSLGLMLLALNKSTGKKHKGLSESSFSSLSYVYGVSVLLIIVV